MIAECRVLLAPWRRRVRGTDGSVLESCAMAIAKLARWFRFTLRTLHVTIVAALSLLLRVAPGQDFTINKIVGNLNQPTFVTFAPGDDNDLYIAELRSGSNVNNLGRIVRYDRSTQTNSTVIDLSSLGTLDDGGLVGMAFHPDFQTNGLFYIDYNRAESGTFYNYIQEYHMNPDGTASLTSRGTILKYPTLNSINYHTVDWIGFDPTAAGAARNYLYVTTGDGGPNIGTGYATSTVLPAADRNGPYPIKPTNLYGKILRLNIDPAAADAYPSDANKNFAIPPTNPLPASAARFPKSWPAVSRTPFA